MRTRRKRQGGNSIIEFTLVGIPLIFVLISIFEIARGMWIYHTLAYSVTEGTRFASFHGIDCTPAAGNSCTKTIADIAAVIKYTAAGLAPDQLTLTFTTNSGASTTCTLQNCITSYTTSAWPPANANLPGMDLVISAKYPFSSAVAMFWPGAASGMVFPTFQLPATSRERIQF